jgi:hypothetical protein
MNNPEKPVIFIPISQRAVPVLIGVCHAENQLLFVSGGLFCLAGVRFFSFTLSPENQFFTFIFFIPHPILRPSKTRGISLFGIFFSVLIFHTNHL